MLIQYYHFQFDIGSCGLMSPGSTATVHIDYRYLDIKTTHLRLNFMEHIYVKTYRKITKKKKQFNYELKSKLRNIFFYKHKDKEDYFVVQNLLNHKNPSIYMGHCVMHRAVREDEISVKKNESVTILSSNLSRGYLVHRPPTSQVVLTIRNRLQHLAFRVLLQKAGSPPIVFISQGRQQENHPRGPSGLHR